MISQRSLIVWFAVVGLAICTSATNQIDAQTSPPAPQVFRPQARAISSQYQPRFMRPAGYARQVDGPVMTSETAVSQGPFIHEQAIGTVVSDAAPGCSCGNCGGGVVGAPVDEVIIGGECGCASGLSGCGGGCGSECSACDPRDCMIPDDCWMGRLGVLRCGLELFTGVQAFKGQGYRDQQTNQEEPCSFGYNLGFNLGLPLYKITCGLVSGQFGLRTVQSNAEENLFSNQDRDQTFITTGFYRRVDYGLQFGAVADILHEEWIANVDLVQIRAELSWVWSGGSTFGYRAGLGVQDDNAEGFIGGVFLPQITGDPIDTHRFFFRRSCFGNGQTEYFAGWSEENHTIIGVDYDIPLSECTALQTGFTYLSPEDSTRFNDNEAFNIYLGVSYRPRGLSWYRHYHRPMFPVADNGSLIIRRNP